MRQQWDTVYKHVHCLLFCAENHEGITHQRSQTTGNDFLSVITTATSISKCFSETSIQTPLLSPHYFQFRHFLHQVSLCCFLLLSRVAWFCLWPVWWGGLTVSIGLWEGLKDGLGYWTEDSVGAASALASQGLVGMHACVCVHLSGRVARMCAWQCVSPVAGACLTWCISNLWPGLLNMNLFCFTLVRCIVFLNFKMLKMLWRT